MRAVLLRAFGTPEVLVATEVADPVAEPGQAVIDVEYVNLTFVETQIRAGRPTNPAMRPELPIVPGNGVGGVVGDVGEGVDPSLIGTRVITSTGGSGAYAERVAVGADGMVAGADDLDMADAVALLADGRTAMLLLRAAQLAAGDVVFAEAAGGGVGIESRNRVGKTLLIARRDAA